MCFSDLICLRPIVDSIVESSLYIRIKNKYSLLIVASGCWFLEKFIALCFCYV